MLGAENSCGGCHVIEVYFLKKNKRMMDKNEVNANNKRFTLTFPR